MFGDVQENKRGYLDIIQVFGDFRENKRGYLEIIQVSQSNIKTSY